METEPNNFSSSDLRTFLFTRTLHPEVVSRPDDPMTIENISSINEIVFNTFRRRFPTVDPRTMHMVCEHHNYDHCAIERELIKDSGLALVQKYATIAFERQREMEKIEREPPEFRGITTVIPDSYFVQHYENMNTAETYSLCVIDNCDYGISREDIKKLFPDAQKLVRINHRYDYLKSAFQFLTPSLNIVHGEIRRFQGRQLTVRDLSRANSYTKLSSIYEIEPRFKNVRCVTDYIVDAINEIHRNAQPEQVDEPEQEDEPEAEPHEENLEVRRQLPSGTQTGPRSGTGQGARLDPEGQRLKEMMRNAADRYKMVLRRNTSRQIDIRSHLTELKNEIDQAKCEFEEARVTFLMHQYNLM